MKLLSLVCIGLLLAFLCLTPLSKGEPSHKNSCTYSNKQLSRYTADQSLFDSPEAYYSATKPLIDFIRNFCD